MRMCNLRWMIDQLREMALTNCHNLYVDDDRAHNLQLYLSEMNRLRPTILLVGEAPGYRGCGVTGIPFSSAHLLRTHSFYRHLPCRIPSTPYNKEATATIVHNLLDKLSIQPLCWNAFPHHSHKPDTPTSNRRPTTAEITLGRPILHHLLTTFPIELTIAVGKTAATALAQADVSFTAVRHPSHGGKTQFEHGVTDAIARSNTQ